MNFKILNDINPPLVFQKPIKLYANGTLEALIDKIETTTPYKNSDYSIQIEILGNFQTIRLVYNKKDNINDFRSHCSSKGYLNFVVNKINFSN